MMLAIYLLKVTLCSGILLGYYWLALRNKAFHQWNRFYLLGITVLSLLLPLVQFPLIFENEQAQEVVRFVSIAALDESVVIAAKQKPFFSLSVEHWLVVSYCLVASVLLLITVQAAKGIIKVLSSHPKQKLQQVLFLNTNAPGAPFSFLNYLVWNKEIDLHSQTGTHIFRHELVHIRQKHTLDKIFMILVLIPFWANPFFWLIRKELNDIHEFIADRLALESGSLEDLSNMILNALYPQHHLLLTSPFFQSSIKRRLQMFAVKNQKLNYMSRILVLPMALIVVTAFTVKQDGQKENKRILNESIINSNKDTIPVRSGNIIVEEIKKDNHVIVEDIPKSSGHGIIADTKNNIYLEFDEVDFRVHPNESATKPTTALLIVNGKKVDNNVWENKTIVSQKITVYENNDKEAIELYGIEAAKGTMVFEGARIIDKMESEIYRELQRDTVPKKKQQFAPPVFTKVEVPPAFNGNWAAFLQKNLDPGAPVKKGAPAGEYTVIAQFIVEMDGSITNLKTLTKHGYGMEEEVLKLMKQSPKWVPATQNGRKVRAYKKQPVTFVISEDEEQSNNTDLNYTRQVNTPVLTKVDEEAKFKGNWSTFLKQNLNAAVPVHNGAPAGTYTVIVQFIVDKAGKVHNPKAVTNKGFGMEEEVIRVMRQSTEWEPAKVNGKAVSAYRKQPITFVVSAK